MKLTRILALAGALGLSAAGIVAAPAHAAPVYKLTASYGHGEFQASGEWLCVKDDKADGDGVKIVLSWYENGYHTVTKKAAPSAEPGTCVDLSFPEGFKMTLTLSKTDGSGAISRSVTA